MVAYAKHSWDELGITVWLTPETIFRKAIEWKHFPWPYFHFQKPRWILHIEKIKKDEEARSLYWWLKLGDGNQAGPDEGTKIDVPPMKMGEIYRCIVGDRLISPIGSTAVCITPSHLMQRMHYSGITELLEPISSFTLCEFRSTAEEEYFMPFIAAFVAGLIVGVIVLGVNP